jgi:hypothetical protein
MSILASDEVSQDVVLNMRNIMIENETSVNDYMIKQTDVNENMRRGIIIWLIKTHMHYMVDYNFSEESIFRTINILDRFLCKRRILRTQLQLAASAAFLLAIKIEEDLHNFNVSILINKLVSYADDAFTSEELVQVEYITAYVLNFDIIHIIPCDFIDRSIHSSILDLSVMYYVLKMSLVEYDIIIKWKSSFLVRVVEMLIKRIIITDKLMLMCMKDIKKSLDNPKTYPCYLPKYYTYEHSQIISLIDNYEGFMLE